MSTAETIYELVKALPEGKANLVLAFAQFIQQQEVQLAVEDSAVQQDQPVAPGHAERLALSQQAKGRFAHLPNSSEAFAQSKQAEIDWEDRHR